MNEKSMDNASHDKTEYIRVYNNKNNTRIKSCNVTAYNTFWLHFTKIFYKEIRYWSEKKETAEEKESVKGNKIVSYVSR